MAKSDLQFDQLDQGPEYCFNWEVPSDLKLNDAYQTLRRKVITSKEAPKRLSVRNFS